MSRQDRLFSDVRSPQRKSSNRPKCYVCYMRRISHRELRNNSSEVLRAVDNGESFEITNYGRVVAMIVPAHPTALDRLRAAGRTCPPETAVSELLEQAPLPAVSDSSTELDTMRSDR